MWSTRVPSPTLLPDLRRPGASARRWDYLWVRFESRTTAPRRLEAEREVLRSEERFVTHRFATGIDLPDYA